MSESIFPLPPSRPVPASQCYMAYGTALLVGVTAWWLLHAFQIIENAFWAGLVVTSGSPSTAEYGGQQLPTYDMTVRVGTHQ